MRIVMSCNQRPECPADLRYERTMVVLIAVSRDPVDTAQPRNVVTISGSRTDFDYDNLRLCLTQALPADGY